jgi:hypothetical protein
MAYFNNLKNNSETSKKKASTAFAIGDMLTVDSNGFLVPGGSGKIVGICNEEITSASSDYASTRDLNFSVATNADILTIPVATGSATQTLVGELVDIDASAFGSVDVTASTNDQILVTRIISTTLIEGKVVTV